MPSYVLKTSSDPAEDLYCIYSTVVDAVTGIGTRDEIRAHLASEGGHPMEINGRFAHADALGSSCLIANSTGDGGYQVWYGYTDDSLTIGEGPGGKGELPRGDLSAYCRALLDDEGSADRAARLVIGGKDQ